jgi:hypothetical protein
MATITFGKKTNETQKSVFFAYSQEKGMNLELYSIPKYEDDNKHLPISFFNYIFTYF